MRNFVANIIMPGDKSISHRAFICASIANGKSIIRNFSYSDDVLQTIQSLRKLGARIDIDKDNAIVIGTKLHPCQKVLYTGNSATTLRLLTGFLVGQNIPASLDGDEFLRKRPSSYLIKALCQMGAKISARQDKYPPVKIEQSDLHFIEHHLKIDSAQVKSALLLAGLGSDGIIIEERNHSRNHTELMLKSIGAKIDISGKIISLGRTELLNPLDITIPGDISSSAYFIALAILLQDSSIRVEKIGLNDTRIGFLQILKRMGADIQWQVQEYNCNESYGWIYAKSSQLKGVEISDSEIPLLIDELPLLAVIGTQAKGETIVRNAEQLRIKESDRISAICSQLKNIGADIIELEHGFIVRQSNLISGKCSSFSDHRIAMSLAVAGAISQKGIELQHANAVKYSFPKFWDYIGTSSLMV